VYPSSGVSNVCNIFSWSILNFIREHGIEELEHGWCFLENVQDPQNPTDNCFPDTQFSVADGRFWSNMACNGTLGTLQSTKKSANLGKNCLSIFPPTLYIVNPQPA
jgi:hypothetical protein